MFLTLTDSRNASILDAGSDVEDLDDVSVLTLSLTNCNYFRNEIVNTVSPLLLLYLFKFFFFSLRYLTPVIFRLETSKENQTFLTFSIRFLSSNFFSTMALCAVIPLFLHGFFSDSFRFLPWFLPGLQFTKLET